MLQISFIRQNKELVKERLSLRNFGDLSLVDKVVKLDEQVRILKVDSETLQADMNAASKAIGQLMAKGEKDAAEQKKQEITQQKSTLQQLNEKLVATEKHLLDEVIKFPNLPHISVPAGKTPADYRSCKHGPRRGVVGG